MKNAKLAFAALAVFTAVATMSFTTSSNKAGDPGDDCWSSVARHLNGDDADINQVNECPGLDGACCFKPDQTAPTGYQSYSENEM